jgi:DNA-binding XRE family transcriptional regulator/mannose-6-phosphate isomerase-like protein (cupin superfamily)
MPYDFAVIRQLRQEHKLTLEELARQAGLTYSTVALMETNKAFPSLKTLAALAAALGVSSSRLLKMAEPSPAVVQAATPLEDNHPVIGAGGRGQLADFGTLKLYHVHLGPGQKLSIPEPHHQGLELGYVVAGSALVTVKQASYELTVGQVIVFDGMAEHHCSTAQGCELILVHVPKGCQGVEQLMENTRPNQLVLATPVQEPASAE